MPVIPLPTDDPGSPGCDWDINPTCSAWVDYTAEQQLAALSLAIAIMWAATGRRFGVCELTVRPCQTKWINQPLDWGGPTWGPVLDGGIWFNRGFCGCKCGPRCEIVLHGPVSSVTEVLVDGSVVPDSAYRVDVARGAARLVRLDGQCWPTCQDFNVGVDEVGAFAVTYGIGIAVPNAVLIAAGILACELAKGVAGGDCKLPQPISRLTRQGVTAEFVPLQATNTGDLLLSGPLKTGIYEVDMVIQAFNPTGRQKPPVVLSPDLPEWNDRVIRWEPGS